MENNSTFCSKNSFSMIRTLLKITWLSTREIINLIKWSKKTSTWINWSKSISKTRKARLNRYGLRYYLNASISKSKTCKYKRKKSKTKIARKSIRISKKIIKSTKKKIIKSCRHIILYSCKIINYEL